MIKIQLGERFLDTYAKEQVELSWDGFRFMKALRAGYTNDLKIPKTSNNLDILGAVGLLDSQTQMFGTKTVRGILQLEVRVLPVFIQVCSVDKNEIGICIYEDCFPEYFKDKNFRYYLKDTPATILEWNQNSRSLYSQYFKDYNYGMPYDVRYAQYHPIIKINTLINAINTASGYDMPTVYETWYGMATRKKVCPQNTKQVIEGRLNSEDGVMQMSGGQHITNDMDIHHGDGQNAIEFNRSCRFQFNMHLAWKRTGNNDFSCNFYIWHEKVGESIIPLDIIICNANTYRNGIEIIARSYNITAGDKIHFGFSTASNIDASFIMDATVSNYAITDDDYDNDLSYNYRLPRLIYWNYENSSIVEKTKYWDGSSFTLTYRKIGGPSGTMTIATDRRSLSYFGIYTNLPNIGICDFYYSLQWVYGKKLSFDHQKKVSWADVNTSKVIDGYISEIRPKSDKLGQKNYIKFKDVETPILVSTINNEWLSKEATLHDSKFSRPEEISDYNCKIAQYSNPDYDAESQEYKVDFNEIDSFVILRNFIPQGAISSTFLSCIPVEKMDLDKLTQSNEVTITTFTPQLRDVDIIFLDGRKYFIVSCKTDLDTQRSELVCLLIPNIVKTSFNFRQQNILNR